MSTQASRGGRWKDFAEVRPFATERLRRSTHHSEETRLSCIYAHYRKWAHFGDQMPLGLDRFERDLQAVTKATFEEFRGERIYQLEVVDPKEREERNRQAQRAKQAAPLVVGQVRVVRDVVYRSDSLSPGQVLDWLSPTDKERDTIEQMKNSKGARAGQYLVIMFKGERRYVPADAVTREL